jgi:hypothetical protein
MNPNPHLHMNPHTNPYVNSHMNSQVSPQTCKSEEKCDAKSNSSLNKSSEQTIKTKESENESSCSESSNIMNIIKKFDGVENHKGPQFCFAKKSNETNKNYDSDSDLDSESCSEYCSDTEQCSGSNLYKNNNENMSVSERLKMLYNKCILKNKMGTDVDELSKTESNYTIGFLNIDSKEIKIKENKTTYDETSNHSILSKKSFIENIRKNIDNIDEKCEIIIDKIKENKMDDYDSLHEELNSVHTIGYVNIDNKKIKIKKQIKDDDQESQHSFLSRESFYNEIRKMDLDELSDSCEIILNK